MSGWRCYGWVIRGVGLGTVFIMVEERDGWRGDDEVLYHSGIRDNTSSSPHQNLKLLDRCNIV